MKIAAAQIVCSLGDIDTNVGKMRDFAVRAKQEGVDLIVFPEVADTGYSMSVIHKSAQEWSYGAVPALREIARSQSIAIISGVSEREGESIYNSQVFIDAKGEIVGKYRKAHLFTGSPGGEDKCFLPGDEFKSFSFGGLQLGLSICYDLRFPEVFRALAIEKRANVFVLSAAWPFPRLEHMRILAIARAIENQSYMILSNRIGTDEGVTCCGASIIVDPYGVILAAGSTDREELVQATISEEIIRTVRKRMAVFDQRRPEIYSGDTR
jgi:omega-amidase